MNKLRNSCANRRQGVEQENQNDCFLKHLRAIWQTPPLLLARCSMPAILEDGPEAGSE